MGKILSILVFALAALAPVLPSRAEESDSLKSRWSVRVELEGRYDDNICELSDRDKDRVGDPAYANRFKIGDPGDFVWAPGARLGWSADLAKRVTTSVQLDASVYRYVRSSVKNYDTFDLRVGQDLSPARRFRTRALFRVSDTPRFYLRELRVPGTSTYDSARYSSLKYGLSLEQVLVPKLLEATVQGSRDRRDYDAPFGERDGDLTAYGATLELSPGGRHTGVRVGYQRSRYDAKGDNGSTAVVEPDISSDRSELSVRVAFRWALGYVTLLGARERRDYTTDNPADIYHFSREDTRTEYGIRFRQGLPARLYLDIGLRHEKNDSQLAPGVSGTLADDVTDYTRNVVSASLGWRLLTGADRRKDANPWTP